MVLVISALKQSDGSGWSLTSKVYFTSSSRSEVCPNSLINVMQVALRATLKQFCCPTIQNTSVTALFSPKQGYLSPMFRPPLDGRCSRGQTEQGFPRHSADETVFFPRDCIRAVSAFQSSHFPAAGWRSCPALRLRIRENIARIWLKEIRKFLVFGFVLLVFS